MPEGTQDVPVGRKPVEDKAVELDSGYGTLDAPLDVRVSVPPVTLAGRVTV